MLGGEGRAMAKARLLFTGVVMATAVGVGASWAQPPMPMPPQDFAMAAEGSDTYEIQAARDAAAQSHDPRVQAFARRMIQDHMRLSERLRQSAAASGLTPPPMALDDTGQKLLAQLQSLRGPDFDKAYAHQQVLSHQMALVVEQGYAEHGADANLRQAARSALPVIQRHLRSAQELQASLGGS